MENNKEFIEFYNGVAEVVVRNESEEDAET